MGNAQGLKNIVVALANVSVDLNQIVESPPSVVGSETMIRLRDMAEYLNDSVGVAGAAGRPRDVIVTEPSHVQSFPGHS